MIKELKNNHEIIKEIQDRFRFIILEVIFFYTIFSNLIDIYYKEGFGEFTITYSVIAALYFSIYLTFEITKKSLKLNWLNRLNLLSLFGIGIFIFSLISLYLATIISSPIKEIILKVTVYGIILIPILLTTVISWAPNFQEISKIWPKIVKFVCFKRK